MVNLTRIYTRTGDQGTTALGDMSRVAKTDLRISAYADANEANAVLGRRSRWAGWTRRSSRSSPACRTTCSTWARTCRRRWSRTRSSRRCGSSSSTSTSWRRTATASTNELEKLRSFILPGGTPGAALLHQACTVVRRAERSTWAALEVHGELMNPLTATYLNRLSDLLFILARTANKEVGDVLWVPGGER